MTDRNLRAGDTVTVTITSPIRDIIGSTIYLDQAIVVSGKPDITITLVEPDVQPPIEDPLMDLLTTSPSQTIDQILATAIYRFGSWVAVQEHDVEETEFVGGCHDTAEVCSQLRAWLEDRGLAVSSVQVDCGIVTIYGTDADTR